MKWLLSSIHPLGCSGVSLSLSLSFSLYFLKPHSKCVSEGDGAAWRRRRPRSLKKKTKGGVDQQERTGAGQIILPGEVHSTGQQPVKKHPPLLYMCVCVCVSHAVFTEHALCAIFTFQLSTRRTSPCIAGELSNASLCPRQISAAIGIWLYWRILSVRQLVHNLWQFFVQEDYHWKCYHIFTTTPLTLNRLSHIPSQSALSHIRNQAEI